MANGLIYSTTVFWCGDITGTTIVIERVRVSGGLAYFRGVANTCGLRTFGTGERLTE